MTPTDLRIPEPAWLTFARAEMARNVREVAGPESHPRILDYFTSTRLVPREGDDTAWCAAFVGFCLQQSGYEPSRSAAARSYLKWGIALLQPRMGCVVVLKRGANPLHGHVGFWVGQSPRRVLLLGGNQGNAITMHAYEQSRVIGYRWPLEEFGAR